MRKDIAKIESTMLGIEDHGIFTCMLYVDYGNGGHQGIGGYSLDTPVKINGKFSHRHGTAYGMEFIARIMRACGVDRWEKVAGRTIFVLTDLAVDEVAWGTGSNRVLGIENLPTERGERFLFADLVEEFSVPA